MVFEPRVSVYRILVFFYTPVTLPLGFEGWVGLAQEDMVQGLSRKVEYFCCGGGGGHMKEKVRVEILGGIRLWTTLNTIRKNLGLTKYIERRNHKIFNRGMI